jgi:hypothetical protein
MSRHIIIVLMHHHHKFLDIISYRWCWIIVDLEVMVHIYV